MLKALNFPLRARQRDAHPQPEQAADQPADGKARGEQHRQQRRNAEFTLSEQIVESDLLVILRPQRH